MIDWTLAEQLAGTIAGGSGHAPLGVDLRAMVAEDQRRVIEYTGLEPAHELPPPEVIDRREWARANLRSIRPVLDPVVERMGDGLGPLRTVARAGTGYLVAAEVGAVMGFLAQRVLGQYEVLLLDPDSEPRLLFVAPNLEEAISELGADRTELVRWVALHEATHAVQFAGVPWLREHLGELLRGLLSSLEASIDPARLLRLPDRGDIDSLVAAVRQGDLVSLAINPDQRDRMDRMQNIMSVVEGHAEHVMDAVGVDLLPSLPQLRAGFERRRGSRSAPARLIARLIGLELKLRQYRLGKRFCDAVVAEGGITALNAVWDSPAAIPSSAELEDPHAWLARTRVPDVTK